MTAEWIIVFGTANKLIRNMNNERAKEFTLLFEGHIHTHTYTHTYTHTHTYIHTHTQQTKNRVIKCMVKGCRMMWCYVWLYMQNTHTMRWGCCWRRNIEWCYVNFHLHTSNNWKRDASFIFNQHHTRTIHQLEQQYRTHHIIVVVINTHIHTHTHTYIHTYTHTHKRSLIINNNNNNNNK